MRSMTFLAPIVASFGLWGQSGQWAGWAGLVLIALPIVVIWPPLIITVVVGVPYALASTWPRNWRASYRARAPRNSRHNRQSSTIERWQYRAVHTADRHRCVYCKQRTSVMHVDHGVPWSWGGLTMLPNLYLLCDRHNLIKSSYWRDEYGVAHGRSANPALADEIIAAEHAVRWRLGRWLLAAWAMS